MRVRILSDLHLECAPFDAPACDADAVVLAGDVHNGAAGILWAGATFRQPVLYVAGNHEYYGHDVDSAPEKFATAARACGVTLLDCSERNLAGVRFLGCTLWADYTLAPPGERARVIDDSRMRNPDYVAIRRAGRPFTPEDSIELCGRHRAWLADRLSEEFAGPTVVITHFAPHPRSIAPVFATHPANPAFIVDLEFLMGRAALWIHGHTHTRFDYRVHGTRVVCNPRGYPGETTGFDPAGTIALT